MRSAGPVTLRLRGSPGTTTTLPPSSSTSAASSVASAPARVRVAQDVGAERLGRLHRDQPDPVDGGRDAHVVDPLQRVGDRETRDRAVGAARAPRR